MNLCRQLLVAIAIAIAIAVASLAAPFVVYAQNFPSKPLRLIVRAPPGGTDDLIARLVAPAIGKTLGQQMIVDYRTGAGGPVAWEYVSKQPPDGYTLMLAASGLAAVKSLRGEISIDPFRDFGWVSQVTSFMLVILVHPSLPARTQKELIALARSRPGQLSYGTSGVGATPHLAAEYFKAMAKIQINHVPYKGAGPMYLDLIGGRIEMGSAVLGSALPHIRSGRVRALGVSGAQRSPQLPDVPSLGGTVKGYEASAWFGMGAPAKTPKDVIAVLNKAINEGLADDGMKKRIADMGGMHMGGTPEDFGKIVESETAKWKKVVEFSGASVE